MIEPAISEADWRNARNYLEQVKIKWQADSASDKSLVLFTGGMIHMLELLYEAGDRSTELLSAMLEFE